MANNFIYQAELEAIQNCPPSRREPGLYGVSVYRLATSRQPSLADFLPPSKRRNQPGRRYSCTDHALSFFTTIESIRIHHARLSRSLPSSILSKIGNTIAECVIASNDGHACNLSTDTGHFDLHPYVETKIESSCISTQELAK